MTLRTIARQLLASSEPEQGRFLAYCALIAFFGGGVKAAMRRTERTRWFDVILSAGASGLAGLLVSTALLYLWPTGHNLLIATLAGIAGWIGVALLDLAASLAMARIRRETGDDSKP